ncbi:MAG: hypothetical protein GY754_04380 [bacterium]|nr:hypothetical protein [bacterium]
MANEERVVQGEKPPADRESWMDYSLKLQQESPNRIEDAAKFLATIISLTIMILFTAPDKLKIYTIDPTRGMLALLCWLGALIFAFLTLFPKSYSFSSKSVNSIKETLGKITRIKKLMLAASMVFYFVPLLFLAILSVINF